MNHNIGAIITGGDFQGLAVIRTLGEKGIPLVLLDHEQCIGKFSKYKKRYFRTPPPAETDAYFQFLLTLIKREGLEGWVIFPNSDQIVYNISKYRDILEKYIRVPVPYLNVINSVYNKNHTYNICLQNDIPIPKTYFAENLHHLLSMNLKFPLVLKPAVRDHFYSKVRKKAFRVNTVEQLKEIYSYMSKYICREEILVQEFIDGGPKNLYSFCPFFKDNNIVTGIMARRSRQHPMDFGHATTFAEIVNIPELRDLAEKFLRLIDYYGICEVEFMYDSISGTYKLIEVNPRIWGWHSLAIAAGLDLPYMLYLDMIGENTPDYLASGNLKWIRFTTDTVTAAKEILKGKMNLTEYIQSLKGDKAFAVFSWKDPLPFFTEILLIPYLWKKRGF